MGGESVHVTLMFSKFSVRQAGFPRKCVPSRVPGRQGPLVWSPAGVLDTEARGVGGEVLGLEGHVDAERG